MKVLVINSGSSSLKYQLIDMQTEAVIAKGTCERIGIDGSKLTHKANGKEYVFEQPLPNHTVAVALVLNALTDKDSGVISSMSDIDAVGHRAVASGEVFKKPTLVTDEVLEKMEAVDYSSVKEVIDIIFDADNFSFSAVGNTEGLDFEEMIKNGKEILYSKD